MSQLRKTQTTFGEDGRWLAQVTYVVQGGDLLPIDLHVRLLPAGATLQSVERGADKASLRERIGHPDATPVKDLEPIPAGGLSQRQLRQVNLRQLADVWREAARNAVLYGSEVVPLLDPGEYEDSPRKRVGRPPAQPLHERLRMLAAVEDGFRHGRSLADVAAELYVSRSSLRDLLSWARNDAEPRLFTGGGQGRRGGELTPHARALMTTEGGATDGKR